jgi:competence protein ComEA
VDLPFPVSTRRLLAVALVVLVAVAFAVRHAHPAKPAASVRVAPLRGSASTAAGRSSEAPASLVVDVEGAVRRPGLVRLPPGSRVADAVARAGGTTRRADRSAVNLAAPVSDGQQVLVPLRGAAAGGPAAATAGSGSTGSGPVSLSAATAEQLDALPGIGPVTAQKIIGYRTQHGAFHSVDELDAIPGIGPARIAELHGLVVP